MLSALRRAHADYFFGIQYKLAAGVDGEEPAGLLHAGRALAGCAGAHAAGHDPYEKNLDAALSPETPPKPDELKAALLAVYAKFELFNGTVHQKAGLHLHLDGLLASS